MSVRNHVSLDRLTALALTAGAPEDGRDREAWAHVSACAVCADALSRVTVEMDGLRDAAVVEADALFSDGLLEAQRARIFDRIAHLGQVARVLRFPARGREVAMPVSGGSRWISVAAAAGLIIGLLAGQILHVVPWRPASGRETSTSMAPPTRTTQGVVPASTSAVMLTDEELLDEVEAAVQLRRASALRALDALTPTAGDYLELPPGR